ncbi:MAG: symmetrical bis(5'-nucleosyl)-tetraphosphatase [Betaproteobacteria bacterium]
MATYAIGDLQGCFEPLERLLDAIGYSRSRDRLWFVGDLVNRGPASLEVLRFAKDLGERAVCVLGNHDLHLLVAAAGFAKLHRGDTLDAILEAPDRDALLDWLRACPLMHVEGEYAMVHAGLLPQWTIEQALALAREAEAALRVGDAVEFFRHMYGNRPDHWEDELAGWDRLRVIVNAMTRLRICTAEGVMEFSHKGELADIPDGFMPWFDVPGRRSTTHTVLCGHWSALGLRNGPRLLALDTGCLWGRSLTAVRLEDRQLFRVSCPEQAT